MDSNCYINWDRVVLSMQELRSFTGAARDEMVEGLSLPGLGTEHATPKPLPSSLPVSQATTQPRCVSDGPVMRRLAAQLSVIGDRTARWCQLMPGAPPRGPFLPNSLFAACSCQSSANCKQAHPSTPEASLCRNSGFHQLVLDVCSSIFRFCNAWCCVNIST